MNDYLTVYHCTNLTYLCTGVHYHMYLDHRLSSWSVFGGIRITTYTWSSGRVHPQRVGNGPVQIGA